MVKRRRREPEQCRGPAMATKEASPKMAKGAFSLTDALTKDFLTCQICLELFQKPKILPCLHTYCEPCLQELIQDGKLRCPECREDIEVAKDTVSLKTNFFINSLLDLVHSTSESDMTCILCHLIKNDSNQKATFHCLDCLDDMCHTCASGHRYSRLTHDHQIIEIQDYLAGKCDLEIRARHAVKCQKHDGENLHFLCKPCSQLICRECQLDHHRTHECLSLLDAMESHRPVIESLLKGVEGNLQLIANEKSAMEDNLQNLKSQDANIKQIVEETFSREIVQVSAHKQDTLESLAHFVKEQEKASHLLKSDLDLQEQVAKSTVAFVERILSLGNKGEILSLEKMITERLQQLHDFSWRPLQKTTAQLSISGERKNDRDLFQLSFTNSQQQTGEAEAVTYSQTISHEKHYNNYKGCSLSVRGIPRKGDIPFVLTVMFLVLLYIFYKLDITMREC